MIAKKQAITYIDDVILQAKTKAEMWKNLDFYLKCLRSSGLKATPNKTKLFLRKIQFLGHIASDKGIQPVAKKVQDLKNLKSPENKRDVMRILGSLGFYSAFIKILHVNSKPFYELLRDDVPFKWTNKHEKLFRTSKTELVKKLFLLYPIPGTHFIFMLIHPALVLDPSWYKSFQVKNVEFRSILECSQRMNKRFQPCIVKFVESYPLYKLMSISSSVHHIPSNFFVTTSHCCTCGHEKEDCLTVSSDTM